MPDENVGTESATIVQQAANSTAFVNTKFGADMMNLALSNAVNNQQILFNEAVRMGRVSEAVSGAVADRFINNTPLETAGEAKVLYGTPPTGFTGVGHYPAEKATGS